MKRDAIARRFDRLDLHDDDLVSVKVSAPRTNKNNTSISFELEDDASGDRKLLTFRGCANLRYVMDFDVLARNWFAQTERCTCNTELNRMMKFVRNQRVHWHTQYMPPKHKNRPIWKKLATLRRYRLFKITFFGGTVEILARSFVLTIAKKKKR